MAIAAAAAIAMMEPGQVAACIGIPGSGKTYTAMAGLDACKWGQRAVLFDPYAIRDRSNWQRGIRHRAPWWPSSPVATLDQLIRNPGMLDRARVRLVVAGTRGTLDAPKLGRDFSTLAALLWETGDLALVGEECGIYSRNAAAAINQISTGGAHAGMRLLLLCQRLGRVQKDAREGITTLVSGAQPQTDEVRSELKDRCGEEFAAKVMALRPPDRLTKKPGDAPIAWVLGEENT